MWGSRRYRAPVLLWAVAAGVGCGQTEHLDPAPELPRSQDAPAGSLELPVRVHLLQSESVEALHSTLTDDEVAQVFAAVNQIWAPAEMSWTVMDIVREPALAQDRFAERARQGQAPDMTFLQELIPLEQISDDGWDLFIGRRVGGAPGVYFGAVPAVLTSEIGPDRKRMSANMTRVLAHELGHAVGLGHISCPEGGNLMSPGGPPLDAGPITALQIETARRSATERMGRQGA